jgi:hypothetical protein
MLCSTSSRFRQPFIQEHCTIYLPLCLAPSGAGNLGHLCHQHSTGNCHRYRNEDVAFTVIVSMGETAQQCSTGRVLCPSY